MVSQFDRLGTPASEADLATQVEESFTLASRDIERSNPVDPFNQFVPGVQAPGWPSQTEKKESFADKPEGIALAKDLGLTFASESNLKKAAENK